MCQYEVLNDFVNGRVSIDHANSSQEKIKELSHIMEQHCTITDWGVTSLEQACRLVKDRPTQQIFTDGRSWRIADKKESTRVMTADQIMDEINNDNNITINVALSEIKEILGE